MDKHSLFMFDLDGTLLDTIGDLASSVNFALEKNGLPRRSTEEIRFFVGNGVAKLVSRALPDGCDMFDRVYEDFMAHYSTHLAVETKPYEGITELVSSLKAKGKKLAVVSNKPNAAATEIVEKFFPRIFDVTVGTIDGVPKKPCPEQGLIALAYCGETKENTVFIGDSDVDIVFAEKLGVDSISVSWGFKSKEFLASHGAKRIVDKAELLLTDK